jgi:hypothetical protein
MGTPLRSALALVLIGVALAAAAMSPARGTAASTAEDFMGSWITWAGSADGEQPVCRRLHVSAEGAGTRDGTWDAPGWNVLVNGIVRDAGDGHPEWQGEWRDGQIAGRFALTLRADDDFEGTVATPGSAAVEHWQGRRDTGRPASELPCRFER